MKIAIGYFKVLGALFLFLTIPSLAFAQSAIQYCGPENTGIVTAIGCIETTPNGFVTSLFRIAMGMGGGIAFLMILIGGLQIQTSTGDPKRLQQGREIIEGAIIGLLMIIFSIVILRVIGVNILGIPGFR